MRPLFVAATAFAAGIALSTHPLAAISSTGLSILTAVLCMGGCIAMIARQRRFAAIGLAAAFMAAGIVRGGLAKSAAYGDISGAIGHTGTVVAQVASLSQGDPRRGVSVDLDAHSFDRVPAEGGIRATLPPGDAPTLGALIRLQLRLEAPQPATNPGQFDSAAALRRRGIRALGFASAPPIQLAPPSFWNSRVSALRKTVQDRTRTRLPPERAAVAGGILLSLRDDIPADLNDAFARTGAVHILSTSGMHLALLATFLFALLRPLPAVLRASLIIIAVVLVAAASGNSPAAGRAAVMAAVALAAPLLRRESEPRHALAFAALCLLILQPRTVDDPGFQLSVAGVWALIALLPPLMRLLFPPEPDEPWPRRAARTVCAAFLASILCSIVTAPLTALHFGQISLIAPLANLFVALLSEWVLLVGAAAVLLDPVPLIGDALWLLVDLGVTWLIATVRVFAAPSWAVVSAGPAALYLIGVELALLLPLARLLQHRARRYLFAGDTFGVPPAQPGAASDHVSGCRSG